MAFILEGLKSLFLGVSTNEIVESMMQLGKDFDNTFKGREKEALQKIQSISSKHIEIHDTEIENFIIKHKRNIEIAYANRFIGEYSYEIYQYALAKLETKTSQAALEALSEAAIKPIIAKHETERKAEERKNEQVRKLAENINHSNEVVDNMNTIWFGQKPNSNKEFALENNYEL